jgi:tetrahydromethanopterin S-methyltransferase subunit D
MTLSPSRTGKSRSTVHVNFTLENRLLAYVTAAGAAGVGLAAIAQPAEAKIVYTPLSNVQLYNLTTVDLNGDGVPDLSFKFYSSNYGADQFVYPGAGGALVFGSLNNVYGPFPNPWLTRIGPKSKFSTERGLINAVAGCHSTCENFGLWVKQTDRYLGIKFLIAGKPTTAGCV